MDERDEFTSIISELLGSATVESVFGDPIENDGRTIVPVSKIGYGFGGGYGPDSDSEARKTGDEEPDFTGAGMGGGVIATPTGVVEITDSETRFIRFGSNRKLAVVALACLALGYALGRTSSFRD